MSRTFTIAVSSHSLFDVAAELLGQISNANVARVDPDKCGPSVMVGTTDCALVDPATILKSEGLYDVLPGFAFSSWEQAGIHIALTGGLNNPPGSIIADDGLDQFLFVSVVALKENYGFHVKPTGEKNSKTGEITTRTISPDSGLVLDLAQEWTEAVAYPLVLGLLAVRRDTLPDGTQEFVSALREVTSAENALTSPTTMAPGMRFVYDDVVTASLTAFGEHLFYLGETDELESLDPVQVDHHFPEL